MKKTHLFRSEVIENRQHQHFGTVFINTPIQFQVIIPLLLIITLLIILFLCFAEFSEKFIVSGYVNSTKGVVRVFPNKNGVILKSKVIQGMHVKKGEELFLIDTSQVGIYKTTRNALIEQIQSRKALIDKEIHYKNDQLISLKELLKKKYITKTDFDRRYEELIQLKNNRSLLLMELIKYNEESAYSVRSPINGTISTVIYKEGQYANISKPLVKILPDNADLIAEIFVPINQSGFISSANRVLIRYDAYPYTNFGTYGATINEISQSILMDDEEDKPITIGVPYYKVIATLDQNYVKLYGHEKRIQDGMTFSAVIMGKRKKVWQWILDPLYSYRGAVFS